MNTKQKHNVYFLGAGGIGMSALARYFKNIGCLVAGYDRVSTPLTQNLISEGIDIHFTDSENNIPDNFKNPDDTLVVYTPAIPEEQHEFNFFKKNGFEMVKRAHTLGTITNPKKSVAVAGTHGKTSVSTLIAYLLKNSKMDCSAFLGGISKNFETNYLLSDTSDFVVVEADEFDRSFLHLNPYIAIITAIDSDHLDIYLNRKNIVKSFNDFVNNIKRNGKLLINKKIIEEIRIPSYLQTFSYSLDDNTSDFYVIKSRLKNGLYDFSLHTPNGDIKNITLGIPGSVNLENTVVAIATVLSIGVTVNEIKKALPHVKGVKRRFDILFKSENIIYVDDYAHHPEEIRRLVQSLREIFPNKKITGIFQPHLFSRTRDFADEFAQSLSLFDKIYLLDIYPAREEPIPGITSEIIFNKITCDQKMMCSKNEILLKLENENIDVLVTIGAGDIDTLTIPIIELFKRREN